MSATARSPLSGCAILIAAVLMLVFLIGFSIWVPFRQAGEIEKFTRKEPVPLPIDSLETEKPAVDALAARFEAFGEALADDSQEAEIALSAADLNLAIARYPAVKELRGTFRVREIKDEELVIDISYRLNGRPRLTREEEEGFITSDPLFLVGTLYGHPVLTKRELVLKVDRVDVPDAEIPEGFLGHFSTLRLFESSLKDPSIGPAMGKLTSVNIEGDKLRLARVPGAPLPDVITDEAFAKSGGKVAMFLGAAFLIFLVVAGTLLFIGYRTQLRRLEEKEKTSGDDTNA